MYLLSSTDLVMSIYNPNLGFLEEGGAVVSGTARNENQKH